MAQGKGSLVQIDFSSGEATKTTGRIIQADVKCANRIEKAIAQRSRDLAKAGYSRRLLDLQRAYGVLMSELPQLQPKGD